MGIHGLLVVWLRYKTTIVVSFTHRTQMSLFAYRIRNGKNTNKKVILRKTTKANWHSTMTDKK